MTARTGVPRRVASALPVVLLLLSGCAGKPEPSPAAREPSHALAEPGDTPLGRMLAMHRPAGADGSGLSLVDSGPEALATIRGMIRLAEKTVDLQYYIWRDDETGRLLLSDLLDAADRGVRVRLLLDDFARDLGDDLVARLDAHPEIEIRLFNPWSRAGIRLVELVVDFRRITHRMHNKLVVADNTLAMIGGRNIGNQYFALDPKAHFRDLDLHVAGPVVRELSASFDAFWNSGWSLSIDALHDGPEKPRALRKALAPRQPGGTGKAAAPDAVPGPPAEVHVERVFSDLLWTDGVAVVADAPDKAETKRSRFLEELYEKLPAPRSELLIESAFLVPGPAGVDAFCRLASSGVDVRILTNSLASIDSLFAYAGYRKYRVAILDCGVQLHELRPRGSAGAEDRAWSGTASSSILHTKAAVIDRRYLFIGSFNVDPRSVHLNTEIALLVDDRRLAERAAAFIGTGLSPDSAYRLALEGDDIGWHTRTGGEDVRLTEEPGITIWGQLVSWLITLLPIEKQI